jgi:hypothetical protein
MIALYPRSRYTNAHGLGWAVNKIDAPRHQQFCLHGSTVLEVQHLPPPPPQKKDVTMRADKGKRTRS